MARPLDHADVLRPIHAGDAATDEVQDVSAEPGASPQGLIAGARRRESVEHCVDPWVDGPR
eukprot:10743914-Lingulodinium_polyedra.AAC.1